MISTSFRHVLAFVLMVAATGSFAQHWPSELWHDGKMVLDNGDTLRGMLKYDLEQNVVQYAVGNRQADAYSARNVLFFEIFDETVRRYRQFYALPYNHTPNYKTPFFFELLEEGKITLLSREKLEYKTSGSHMYGGLYGAPYQRIVLTYFYYLMHPDGSIEDFRGTRNDLLTLMDDERKQVQKYIRAHRLDFDDKYDVARMVAYYNSLTGS